jgi:hypothetical protein
MKGVSLMNRTRKMVLFAGLVSLLLVLGGLAQVYAAETVTVKGEVIDTYCYALMGAKGESHRGSALSTVSKPISQQGCLRMAQIRSLSYCQIKIRPLCLKAPS